MRSWVQTPVLPKSKKEEERNQELDAFLPVNVKSSFISTTGIGASAGCQDRSQLREDEP
jgi:hypothetical protein